ncbi:MAG: polynucleotide adenylyltransferase PcnB [Treponema sp.]
MLIRYSSDSDGKYTRQAYAYTRDEHKINKNAVDSNARHIVEKLQHYGYEAYIVGGAVRDLIVGNIPKDFDIATSATPKKIKSIFPNSRIIGRRFRLVHVYISDKIYEVSTFRSIKEGSVGNQYGKIEEDVHRRDFTCNALYYDPIKDLVIDYVDGFLDIKNKSLRAIIPRKVIFFEDPVRLIRAIKYACTTKSRLPLLLRWQIKREAPLLEWVSSSRLTEEINKIFFSSYVCDIVKMLFDYGLYNYIQPNACIFIYENKKFKDAYFSSMQELNDKMRQGLIKKQSDFLVFLIMDYINLISSMEHTTKKELYNFVYTETRHFVLPMNPQRKELEDAVKVCINNVLME